MVPTHLVVKKQEFLSSAQPTDLMTLMKRYGGVLPRDYTSLSQMQLEGDSSSKE